jgi:hypothetical protein
MWQAGLCLVHTIGVEVTGVLASGAHDRVVLRIDCKVSIHTRNDGALGLDTIVCRSGKRV